jgi:hypothetical protein
MQGRIDILASDISVAGQADFVADSGVQDVDVNNVGANGLVFANAAGESYFDLGDNALLQKLWAVINWGFGQGGYNADRAHNIGLVYWDGVQEQVINPPFNNTVRSIAIPVLCCPLEFGDGLYLPMPTTGTRRQIRLSNLDLRVSMVGLPGIFDGLTYHVQYFLQVLHTSTLKVAP